jgi:Tfp pilus assembly protein PilV
MPRIVLRPCRALEQTGLTLVEFLFACSIMAFVALGVAGMFPSALRSVVGGGQMTKATVLAQEMANMIRNELFDTVYLTPESGNGYTGYSTFTTTASLPATCPTESCSNKKKWKTDLLADAAQTSGRGLPGGYGTVAVTCLNVSTSSPYTLTTGTCGTGTNLLRLSVTVYWDRTGSRSVNLVTYVARSD